VQDAGPHRVGVARNTEREEDQHKRRRQREAGPGRQCPGIAGARQAERHADLAARRPRQELADRDEVCVAALAEALPPGHEFVAEVAEVATGPPNEVSPRRRKIRKTAHALRSSDEVAIISSRAEKKKANRGRLAFRYWWSRGGSNPRPQVLYRQFYIRSPVIWL
jgi:hypothetical protein